MSEDSYTKKDVLLWILQGHSYDDIAEMLGDNPDAVLFDAFEILRAQLDALPPSFEWHLSARRFLYERCLNIADYKQAHAVLVDMAKLTGLYKNEITIKQPKQTDENDPWKGLKVI